MPDADAPEIAPDELFSLADAAAAIINAPVTIEDNQSRMLAYSFGQNATDQARVSTIISRRVPEDVVAYYRAHGVFRRLANSDEPFLTPQSPDGTRPRLVVPVRAGSEWLGSIWAIVGDAVDAPTLAQMRAVATAVATHLLRLRAQADIAHRESTKQIRKLLLGTSGDAAAKISLPPAPWRVVALSGGQSELDVQRDRWRVTCRQHGWAEPLLADVDRTVFALVTDAGGGGSWSWLRKVITDLHRTGNSVNAAASSQAMQLADLSRSRRQAAELLAVMDRAHDDNPARTVEQSWAELAIARAVATVDATNLTGPLASLRAHDDTDGTDYLATLAASLNHPGQPLLAARQLQVHVNTLRYRMNRLKQLMPTDLDLADPTVRLALTLQLTALTDATPQRRVRAQPDARVQPQRPQVAPS